MNKINLIFFKTPYNDKIINSLSGIVLSPDNYNFIINHDPNDLIKQIENFSNGIFLFYIQEREDLVQSACLLKAISKLDNKRFFQFFCVLTYDYTHSEKILKKLGCLGFYTPAEKPELIARRIESLRNKMQPHLSKEPKTNHLEDDLTFRSIHKSQPEFSIRFTAPLTIESDIWLIKSKSDCSFLRGTCILQASGPSSHVGKWIESSTIADPKTIWRFDLSDPDDTCFVSEKGNWYFEGERPQFDWNEKKWRFRSTSSHLYFKQFSGEIHTRFKFQDNTMTMAENSIAAREKMNMISATNVANMNITEFQNSKQDYLNSIVIKEFSLESGKINVNIEYEPSLSDFNLDCEFEDLHEKELVVWSKVNSIENHSNVRARVQLVYNGEIAKVTCYGKIAEIETIDEKDFLTINVEKMDLKDLKSFLDLYQLRQTNINNFLTLAKGY